jgi:CBS domain-containing protein
MHCEELGEQLRVTGKPLNLRELMRPEPVVVISDDPLRAVVNRVAQRDATRMPVVERGRRFLG